ncbi:6-phospho-3-hexuloisomerase [Vulcanisaeta souniana]|uniref:6-phospho-3-hexuloisomerase n=1 Tax=Vulcanisaeta souniana JCM 11219 TaxID=1293586 RepID=A0A830EBW5_9CREN|nr:6-phospho-3-hexuloisomerase [Vulcanisaeta souniana]BDR91920.1 6-phospho-3-hexuloisomerase [Vulcanisaeta souniana JCM 11219]GGI69351.1 6-phospho-3-hexuloisomerase [Vulcanisaeta souniana JCM 11219]
MEDLNYFKSAYVEIGNFILNALNAVNIKEIESFVDTLINVYRNDKKVLVVGAGRSGLVGRAFAMRLMHLGFRSYVLGETITPSVGEGDLVVAISGSGTTTMVVAAAEAAKKMKAMIVAITSYRDSPLASYADLVVQVPGRTKVAKMDDYFARQILGLHEPLAPLGTLFEDTAIVLLDAIIAELMYRLKKTEDEIRMRHANIEIP